MKEDRLPSIFQDGVTREGQDQEPRLLIDGVMKEDGVMEEDQDQEPGDFKDYLMKENQVQVHYM